MPWVLPRAVSVGLRNCYLALPKRHKLFLVDFETASWHVFSLKPSKASKPSQQLSVSIGLRNCYLARFSAPLKTGKTLKTLPADFDGLSLLCHGTSRGPASCFCWASGTSEAPQAVSIGLRNCYLAHFQHPLKPSKPCKTLARAFDGLSLLCHGSSRGPRSCFCWASKLLSGTSEAPQAAIGLRNCYLARFQHPLKPSKPLYIYI